MDTTKINTIENNDVKTSSGNIDIFAKFGSYRGELLGIALIMISIAHCQTTFFLSSADHLASHVQSIINIFNLFGTCGVKIFVFLAGFGAYFSLFRNPDPIKFFIRRAKRMFPYYYPIVFLCILLYKPNLIVIAGNLSLLGWWISSKTTWYKQYFWFHQTIYIIYLMTPTFFSLLNNYKKSFYMTIFLWLLFIGISLTFPVPIKIIGIQAIPIFITGMLLCKLQIEKTNINGILEPILYFLGACSLYLLVKFYPTYGGVFVGYTPRTSEHILINLLTASIMLFFLRVFILITKGNLFYKALSNILSLLGKRALEIYLIQVFLLYNVLMSRHVAFFNYVSTIAKTYNIGHVEMTTIIICIVIVSTVMGILYGYLMDNVLDKTLFFYNHLKFKFSLLYKNNDL